MAQKQEHNADEQQRERNKQREKERREDVISTLYAIAHSCTSTKGEKLEAARLLLEWSKLR